MTVEQLSTSKISSTCPIGVNYILKYAGDLREKSHEVWTRNSNRSRCTRKNYRGAIKAPPPNGIRVKIDDINSWYPFACMHITFILIKARTPYKLMVYHDLKIVLKIYITLDVKKNNKKNKKNTSYWETLSFIPFRHSRIKTDTHRLELE